MRELCRWCFGTGKVDAERFHKTDALGQKITGQIECSQCQGKGHLNWASHEIMASIADEKQRILRKAIDLGGSAFSRESKQFGVEEIRENHITHAYFRPKALCDLLGLIFPGDLEDIEAAVDHARFGIESAWVVKPCTEVEGEQLKADVIRRNNIRCQALRSQLMDQFFFWDWPEFAAEPSRDSRFYSPIKRFKDDVHFIRRGYDVKSGWRAAVEAVRATSELKAA